MFISIQSEIHGDLKFQSGLNFFFLTCKIHEGVKCFLFYAGIGYKSFETLLKIYSRACKYLFETMVFDKSLISFAILLQFLNVLKHVLKYYNFGRTE